MARSKRASTVWKHRIWSVRRRNNQFTELHTQSALACTCTCTCTRSIINRDIIAKHKNQKLKSNLGCLISNEWDRDPQVLINNDACCAWFGWRLVNNTQKKYEYTNASSKAQTQNDIVYNCGCDCNCNASFVCVRCIWRYGIYIHAIYR